MSRTQIIILAVLGVLNVLIFVGAGIVLVSVLSAPAPVPTVAAVQLAPTSTATSLRPTTTPTVVPATPTLVNAPPPKAVNAAVANTLAAALNKSKAATRYRLDMGMTTKGDLGQLAYMANQNQELNLLGMKGELNGSDSHFVLSGFVAAFLSGDPAKPLEIIQVGGKSYVHGPVPLLGARDNRWYVLPESQAASARSSLDQSNAFAAFGSADADFGAMTKTGLETLDNRRCDVYSADKNAALSAFSALGSNTTLTSSDWNALGSGLQKAEYQVWVCDDGYLHQIRMNLEGQNMSKPGEAVGMKFYIHVWDFGGNLPISAPAGAIAPSNPFLPTPSPTRKK